MQKSIVFLYISNEESKYKNKKTIPFKIASKRIKYLGINLTEEVENLHSHNYKILLKDIKKINAKPCQDHGLKDSNNKHPSMMLLTICLSSFSK